jgi:hypothetical protein
MKVSPVPAHKFCNNCSIISCSATVKKTPHVLSFNNTCHISLYRKVLGLNLGPQTG